MSNCRRILPQSKSQTLQCNSKLGLQFAKHLRNCRHGCAWSHSLGLSKTNRMRKSRKRWVSRRALRERACSAQCACCEKNCNDWERTHEEVDERRQERSHQRGGI